MYHWMPKHELHTSVVAKMNWIMFNEFDRMWFHRRQTAEHMHKHAYCTPSLSSECLGAESGHKSFSRRHIQGYWHIYASHVAHPARVHLNGFATRTTRTTWTDIYAIASANCTSMAPRWPSFPGSSGANNDPCIKRRCFIRHRRSLGWQISSYLTFIYLDRCLVSAQITILHTKTVCMRNASKWPIL